MLIALTVMFAGIAFAYVMVRRKRKATAK